MDHQHKLLMALLIRQPEANHWLSLYLGLISSYHCYRHGFCHSPSLAPNELQKGEISNRHIKIFFVLGSIRKTYSNCSVKVFKELPSLSECRVEKEEFSLFLISSIYIPLHNAVHLLDSCSKEQNSHCDFAYGKKISWYFFLTNWLICWSKCSSFCNSPLH